MPNPSENATFPTKSTSAIVGTRGVFPSCSPIVAADERSGATTDHRATETLLIDSRSVVDVLQAINHAAHICLSPTHLITIDWALAGVHQSVEATGRFLKLLKDAARKRGWANAHIWVRESGRAVGDHVHILLHLPSCARGWLARNKAGWLKRCGATKRKGVSLSRPIAGRPINVGPEAPLSALYQSNIDHVAAYILKHCDGAVADAFGIGSRGRCRILGKRVSISRNLHHKARQACATCRATE